MIRQWLALGALVSATVVIAAWPSASVRRVAIETTESPLVETLALDVWTEERGPGIPLVVVVSSADLVRLDAAGIAYAIVDADIDATARAERDRIASASLATDGDWFAEYRDYRAITAHVEQLAALAPERASAHVIGTSLDQRPIVALRIGGSNPNATPMLVNGTQHAREWISAMVTTCVADRLVRDYDTDPKIRAFVDRTTLWVVPVVNPDGYQYSWSTNRYWRKNRRAGHGVDLNRNFSVGWGGPGSSSTRSSDIYRGEAAFSEPETRALRDLALRERIKTHVDFHAFGQLLLYPWGYTATPAPDRDRFAAVGDNMASAIFATHQNRYTLKSAIELYPAGGTMSDWAYGEARAMSYTIELRPKGPGSQRGFVLPPDQIRPTCDEGLAALVELSARTDAR